MVLFPLGQAENAIPRDSRAGITIQLSLDMYIPLIAERSGIIFRRHKSGQAIGYGKLTAASGAFDNTGDRVSRFRGLLHIQ
jgi:hypothetical protein